MYVAKDRLDSPLYVVTTVSNPRRYKTRWELYRKFAAYVALSPEVKLMTVELAFGERDFAVTEADNPMHLRLRTDHELWHKENLINLGVARLPKDWKYAAWIDADVSFARPDWAEATVHQLQHNAVVQMFSEAMDLCPDHKSFMRHLGFAYCYTSGMQKPSGRGYYYSGKGTPGVHTWHPGFAWAIRRNAWNSLGGLIDWAVLGAADNHMAKSHIGDAALSVHPDVHPRYLDMILEWQTRSLKYVRRDIGYVEGLLMHHWHGKKKDRRYWDRWQILVDNQYNPDTDLKRDWQGVWQLTDRSWRLRDQLRAYFAGRKEDSIDVDESERNL